MPVDKFKREFLQLANKYNPTRSKIGGWYVSEKYDGQRVFWDGGITRGVPTETVPWASILNPRTGKRKDKIKPIATGLWTRLGNPVIVPDDFLNQLPAMFLDGELWAGRGKHQLTESIVRGDTPDPRFNEHVKMLVYGTPPMQSIFRDGDITNPHFLCKMRYNECDRFVAARMSQTGISLMLTSNTATFDDELQILLENLDSDGQIYTAPQYKLSNDLDRAREEMEEYLAKFLEPDDKGQSAEGLIVRNGAAKWIPKRHSDMLKWKPYQDDEGTLVGFTSGRETDKGSKHRGKIGALILDYGGKRLEVSGMTDAERLFDTDKMSEYAYDNPDKDMPAHFRGKHFVLGQTITFKFRELTDAGIPKEASYLRPRHYE